MYASATSYFLKIKISCQVYTPTLKHTLVTQIHKVSNWYIYLEETVFMKKTSIIAKPVSKGQGRRNQEAGGRGIVMSPHFGRISIKTCSIKIQFTDLPPALKKITKTSFLTKGNKSRKKFVMSSFLSKSISYFQRV